MIKTYTAYTSEVDDIDAAIEELKAQLDIEGEGKLLANSVAVISCYADFVESGVYSAVCDMFDFDVAGTTTISNAVKGSDDYILLTLMILTSDDVSFSAGITDPITEENDELIRTAYEAAAEKLDVKPSLILSYAPLLMNIGGDYFVDAFDAASGGVPNFGTITVDHNDKYQEAVVLYNGQAYSDRYAFILLGGNVTPHYYVASISSGKVFQEKGVVTASKGNQLQTVNNIPVRDYLESLGLKKNDDGSITGINSFPFIMDLNDGMMPVIRVMFALTPEGYAVCGGNIPVGATLFVGSIDSSEVMNTTETKLTEALEDENHSCFMMYSCIGRYFALGYTPEREIEKVRELFDDTGIPYHFAYSGGELCPVYAQDGTSVTMNRSHNDTLIICAF